MLNGAEIVLHETHYFLTGFVIGIVIAAPVGPVNIMCIQRTLERGFWGGLAAGLGAVAGDGLIASFAAFGMTATSDLIKANKPLIQLVGGVVLIAFGVKLFLTRPRDRTPGTKKGIRHHAGAISQTFLLTVCNPGAILGTAAIFGGFGTLIGVIDDYWDAATVVIGVMCGSLAWWTILAKIISTIHHRLDDSALQLINRVAGIILAGFGAGLLARYLAGSFGILG